MYESPLNAETKIVSEIQKDIEGKIAAKIKTDYNIEVDQEELIKALNYDRRQYSKGYEDGYVDGYEAARNKFESLLEHGFTTTIRDALERWENEDCEGER